MSKTAKPDLKQLRAIGHKLKPVVSIGGNGLSTTVIAELERALDQHELIKVKLAVGGRDARLAISEERLAVTGAELVQSVGNILLVLRRTAKPDPKLSNLLRPV